MLVEDNATPFHHASLDADETYMTFGPHPPNDAVLGAAAMMRANETIGLRSSVVTCAFCCDVVFT
jgi:hypothetical protein